MTILRQANAEHFQQCVEFPLLRNRGLGPVAVTVCPFRLPGGPPLPLAPPCNRQRPFFVAGDRQGCPLFVRAPHCRAVWNCTGCWSVHNVGFLLDRLCQEGSPPISPRADAERHRGSTAYWRARPNHLRCRLDLLRPRRRSDERRSDESVCASSTPATV